MASLPDYHQDIFNAVAERVPVSFYLLKPCPDQAAPGGIKDAWNEAGKAFRERLQGMATEQVELFSPPAGDTVLAALQQDLLGLPATRQRGPLEPFSVQVHSCHGPMREVEVLLDNLLWI